MLITKVLNKVSHPSASAYYHMTHRTSLFSLSRQSLFPSQSPSSSPMMMMTPFPAFQFSRAKILEGLPDSSKISKRKYIKQELTDNPEFFKAFPHLQMLFHEK